MVAFNLGIVGILSCEHHHDEFFKRNIGTAHVTLLASLVNASQRVGATSARLAKVRELAACLRELEPSEIEIGVQYLSGETPQGRFGIGYTLLRDASTDVGAREATLSIGEVDRRLGEIAGIRELGGSGPPSRGPCASSSRSRQLPSRSS